MTKCRGALNSSFPISDSLRLTCEGLAEKAEANDGHGRSRGHRGDGVRELDVAVLGLLEVEPAALGTHGDLAPDGDDGSRLLLKAKG